nr:hypothetical protein HmN_000970200 [Hymenolepis microstoma]
MFPLQPSGGQRKLPTEGVVDLPKSYYGLKVARPQAIQDFLWMYKPFVSGLCDLAYEHLVSYSDLLLIVEDVKTYILLSDNLKKSLDPYDSEKLRVAQVDRGLRHNHDYHDDDDFVPRGTGDKVLDKNGSRDG